MESKLLVKGKTQVCGMEIPNVYGGFGEDQKVILAKTVAELHDKKLKHVNELINNHIDDGYFEEGIDFIDLKKSVASNDSLSELGLSKQSISNSTNIYLLSQQGYTLLLKLMNSELSRKQYKQVIRDYFTVREAIQILSQEELQQLIKREIGIIKRNKETEAISKLISRGEIKNNQYSYASITNITYEILYGMYAKDIKKHLELKERDNLRDFLSSTDLDEIKEIEEEIVWMVKKDYTWRQIYDDLCKEYPNRIIPVKAEKSIKELKKVNKFVIKESKIKLIK